MHLETLAVSASAQLLPSTFTGQVEITGIACDSRRVRRGDLFAALPGSKTDGSAFARQAAEKGAAAILCEKPDPLMELPQLICKDARLSLAQAARAFYGNPDLSMKVGAVTGTNGKSTTAYLLRHLMRKAGLRCGMLGTIEYDLGSEIIEAPLTTPESLDLFRYLRTMADAGCQAAFMEVSSHSLCQHRTAGIDFSVAVFTNLTQDHLDYHRTMDEYREAKALLFRALPRNAMAVLNMDDPAGLYYRNATPARVIGFSLKKKADIQAEIMNMDIHGTVFKVATPWGLSRISWKLAGAHNVQNAIGALAAAVAMGLDFKLAAGYLADFAGVPGRLEPVDFTADGKPLPFRVLVDYAHTEDALRSVMRALRELNPLRLISVFGCGGDRDRTKRPKMAQAVEELADLGIITSDNPRTEDPHAILADICKGVRKPEKFIVEPDRARAIDLAVKEARAGDVILIAGKGHENYQIVGTEKRHFSDVEEALAALQRRSGGA